MSGQRPRVAVCGLGRMGQPMATRIVDSGYEVTVWNRSRAAAAVFTASSSAQAAESPAEASRPADMVVTMLTDGDAVLAVLDGPDGALAGLRPGAIVIDCSTTGAEYARQAARLCAEAGVEFLDCPVSGSTTVAAKGELGLMVGGDAAVLERARPVLAAFGRNIVHVGPTGAGAAAKVAVNGLLHAFSTALAESLVSAESAGVSRSALFDVLAGGVLSCTFLDYKREAFTHPDAAAVAFDLATATKDLGLAASATNDARLPVSIIERALAIHQRALHDGNGAKDMAALAAWFGDQAGPGNPARDEPSGEISERN